MGFLDVINSAQKGVDTIKRGKQVGQDAGNLLPAGTKQQQPPAHVPAPAVQLDRAGEIKAMRESSEMSKALKPYIKKFGENAADAGYELVNKYLAAAEKKPAAPFKEEDVKKFLDNYERSKGAEQVSLNDKEKEGARAIAWATFEEMKKQIDAKGLGSRYEVSEIDGPKATVKDPSKFSQISVLGSKK